MTDAEKLKALEGRVEGLEKDLKKALEVVKKFGRAKSMSDHDFYQLSAEIEFVLMDARVREAEKAKKG